jgi:hypothetical protein
VGEDCTAFVGRACGGRRLFADSPLLRADTLKQLPDALADAESPNARLWARRLGMAALVGALGGSLATRLARAGRARLPSPLAGS